MKILKYFLTIILLVSLAGPGWAATYYVDTASTDGGTGTTTATAGADRAFATLAAVNALTLAGDDVVLLKRGCRWYEKLIMAESGTSGHPITFTAYGTGAKPIIHGGEVLTPASWADEGSNVYSQNFGTCNWVYENDKALPKATATTCLDGNWYHDGAKIWYKASDNSDPRANGKTVCRDVRGMTVDFTGAASTAYVTFDNIQFYASGFYNGDTRYVTGVIVQNCDFRDASNGVNLKAGGGNSSFTVTGCTFDFCHFPIVAAIGASYLNTVTITNNILSNIDIITSTQFSGSWLPLTGDFGGIYLQNCASSTISGNLIGPGLCETDGGIGHWVNTASATNNVFTRNYIHDLEGMGIANGADGTPNTTITITNNIITNCGSGASPPYGGIRVSKPQTGTSLIANNTIYNCDMGFYLISEASGYTIKNNILANNTKAMRSDLDPAGSTILDYNNYYPDSATAFGYGAADDRNFASFHGVYTTWDAHSILTDPLFVNAGGSYALATDFKLPRTSPAAKAGVNVGLVTDYWGNKVPMMGKYPIGVYMFPFKGGIGFW